MNPYHILRAAAFGNMRRNNLPIPGIDTVSVPKMADENAFEIEEAIIGWLDSHPDADLKDDETRASLTSSIVARLDTTKMAKLQRALRNIYAAGQFKSLIKRHIIQAGLDLEELQQ